MMLICLDMQGRYVLRTPDAEMGVDGVTSLKISSTPKLVIQDFYRLSMVKCLVRHLPLPLSARVHVEKDDE